jgi:hypothetical protein
MKPFSDWGIVVAPPGESLGDNLFDDRTSFDDALATALLMKNKYADSKALDALRAKWPEAVEGALRIYPPEKVFESRLEPARMAYA